MIFHDKKLIYIHVPKTGGTSIENFLNGSIVDMNCFNANQLYGFDPSNACWLQHLPMSRIHRYCNQDLKSYFSFGFVRNPYDRAVSSWLWSRNQINLYAQKIVKLFRDLSYGLFEFPSVESLDRDFYLGLYPDLANAYADAKTCDIISHFNMHGIKEGRLHCDLSKLWKDSSNPLHKAIAETFSYIDNLSLLDFLEKNKCYKNLSNKNNLLDKRLDLSDHFHTQSHFLTNPEGEQIVDFIGRFETLNKDFSIVCAQLGLDFKELPKYNISKDRLNYREYYDYHSRALITQIFSCDIERFEYTF